MTDEGMREKMMQMRMLEASIEGMMKNRDMVAQKIGEIEATIASLDELSRSKGEMKFHLGDGVFFPTTLGGGGKIIVSIGADVALEKTPEEAKKTLESRRVEANKALAETQKEIDALTKKLDTMIPEIESAHGH